CVYIRFADQTEFELSREFYDNRFNAVGDETVSLRTYFQKVSYNQLDYVTSHYPTCAPNLNLSWQDSNPRSFYVPYNAVTNPNGYVDDWDRTEREQSMLANAIAGIAAQVPSSLNIDADNDGNVDNVCFIIRGPHTAWADLLWAHRWALYNNEAFINGKQVWDFTFQPEDHNSVRTLCHEMFHSAGSPDLYHYDYNGVTPVGPWDIMESGNGHMGMYMKYTYGNWITSIPSLSIGGTYTLNPVTSPTNNVYKMAIPGSNSQFLVFEYRKRGADIYEADLPGSGLLIYRINTNCDGNSDGPPDEVYVYRPNGSNTVNGQIADATFSANVWRTEFNAFTNPAAVLSNGNTFQVNIHSISEAGDTISFQVSAASDPLAPVISSISPVSGSILPNRDFNLLVNATAPNSTITGVDFYIDQSFHSGSAVAPFTTVIPGAELSPGEHVLGIIVHSANGSQTSRNAIVHIIDPAVQNWFSWMTASPDYEEYGRGALPIQVAVDFDLGSQEYLVKGLRFNMIADPWGSPAEPGTVHAKINRFASGAITDQTLLDLGTLMNPMYDFNLVHSVEDSTRISGQIALILDLHEYQNIRFDLNGPCGHSWITEPNRPWTDALGRGVAGAAVIELLLQAPVTGVSDPLAPALVQNLNSSPNPFTDQASISFSLRQKAAVRLSIYNLRGQKVKTLLRDELPSGTHEMKWNGIDDRGLPVSAGVYLYQLESKGQALTRKLLKL
ncbi:MAG TPA: M6 family metalloprotease domain-containing protein, partial [Candidatus Cloacimonadota bacterium]|nr:M6 family metalloprotease domain-containing protein [Candidatus Cloacimonadota bacterium]